MDLDEFAKRAEDVVDYIINYFQTVSERTVVSTYKPGYLRQLLPVSAPVKGESFENILEDFDKYIMPGLTHWQHPDFHGYYPSLTSYPSILANALSSIVRGVGFNWNSSPAGSELSAIMLEWYGKTIGLPRNFLQHCGREKGGGFMQNTISECVLISMITARQLIFKRIMVKRPNASATIVLSSLVAYCSKEAHFCIQKAAVLSLVSIRILETDEDFRLRGKTLTRAITEDKEIGLIPFFVSITLGSATGACDPLDEIGPICEEYDIWLNVDAAYAGNAFICPEFRHYLNGIEFASSISICPAKWLLVSGNCCLLFVSDRFKVANYVKAKELQYVIRESREFRFQSKETFEAFKLLVMMHCHGVKGLQEHIRNHVRQATLFSEVVQRDQRFEVLSCNFGIVCFRLKGEDEVTKLLLQVINMSGKLIMNSYTVRDKFVIRFVICSAKANEDDILRAWDLIRKLAKEVIITYEINEKLKNAKSKEWTDHDDYRLL